MNIKQKIELHDRFYRYADRLLKKHNPCRIRNGSRECANVEFCCDGCEHLTKNGCSVNCLRCKLHLCYKARANSPILGRIFGRVLLRARRHDLLGFRQSREQVVKALHIWENLDSETNNGSNST